MCLGIIREVTINQTCTRVRSRYEKSAIGVIDCMEVDGPMPVVVLQHGYFGSKLGIVRGSFEHDRSPAVSDGCATDIVVAERKVWSKHEIPLPCKRCQMCGELPAPVDAALSVDIAHGCDKCIRDGRVHRCLVPL